MTDKVAAALRECEEACPCASADYLCGTACFCAHLILRDRPLYPCLWPGHAAIRRYGDLREKAGRLEQAEKMCKISDDARGADEAQQAQREELDRLHDLCKERDHIK